MNQGTAFLHRGLGALGLVAVTILWGIWSVIKIIGFIIVDLLMLLLIFAVCLVVLAPICLGVFVFLAQTAGDQMNIEKETRDAANALRIQIEQPTETAPAK